MFIHPDSHGLFADFLDDAGQGRAFHGRAVNVRKDGSLVPVEVRGSSFLYQGTPHVLGVIRDVTEQVAAYELLEQRVEERTRELSTLLDVSRDVASTLELRPLLRTILEQLHHVVEYVDCTIMRIDGDHLLNLDYRGPLPAEEVLSIAVPIAAIPGLWRDLSCGQPVVIADLRSSDPAAGEFWDAIGEENRSRYLHLRSWLGVPLMAKDQVVGLLTIMHDQPGFYTPHHAELALAIAQHAAIAVENAQLYGQAQELAATEERARLARELHDSVTQALFSMTMHARAAELAMANQGISPDSGVAENLRQLSDLAQGGLAEMRSLIFELRPGALQEEGLIAALRKHCRALTAREGVSIDVDAPAERIPLDPTVEEHLYRLTQEALHNVVKHAAASHVLVRLAHQDGRLLLEVKDDGLGFDPAAIPVGHLGLETMRTRAQSIGAEIAISSAPGEGTTIRVLVPSRGSEGLHG
jgi:signal transduction histidine kinase